MRYSSLLVVPLLALTTPAVQGQENPGLEDEVQLRAAGLPTDGPGLLAFFKNRTAAGAEEEKLGKLIAALGGKEEAPRKAAYQELVGLGPLAVPALRVALNDADLGAASQLAQQCLDVIQGERGVLILTQAARLLAQKNPAGSAEVLLAFLPTAHTDELYEEIKRALGEVGFDRDGKPEGALVKALTDESAIRRAVAVEILGARTAEPREQLRKLLADPKPSVRLKASLALASVKEAAALTGLVQLLGELPLAQAKEAEEFLINLAAEQAPKEAAIDENAMSRQKARDAWTAWWKTSEGPNLLDEFKKRTMSDEKREKTLTLIKQLGNENFKIRIQAQEDLKKLGVVVVPLLRKAMQTDPDPELRDKAKEALVEIEKIAPGSLSVVYPRLVAFRRPAGAVEAMIDFLPFSDDESVTQEIQTALNMLAYQDGKAAPALLTALKDKVAARRVAAAEALASRVGAKELEDVRVLLKDEDQSVKARAAIALAGANDRATVPALIEMLLIAQPEQLALIEDFLSRVAGEDAPANIEGTDAEARKKRRDQWATWWKDNGEKASLTAALSRPSIERQLGYTILVGPNNHKVMEVGRDGKMRWEINGLNNVWDAQIVGKNRVMVLETNSRRVTERNFRGDILWEQSYAQLNIFPLALQRMDNGNVLLIANNMLVEMNRAGKEVFRFQRPNGDLLHARRLRDGSIVYVTSSSTGHKIDGKGGREIKNWRLTNPTNQGIHILPNGNAIYPQQHANRVYETDTNGQQVWTATVMQPMAVHRLPNGNTLVASAQHPFTISEMNRAGKEVGKITSNMQVYRITRR